MHEDRRCRELAGEGYWQKVIQHMGAEQARLMESNKELKRKLAVILAAKTCASRAEGGGPPPSCLTQDAVAKVLGQLCHARSGKLRAPGSGSHLQKEFSRQEVSLEREPSRQEAGALGSSRASTSPPTGEASQRTALAGFLGQSCASKAAPSRPLLGPSEVDEPEDRPGAGLGEHGAAAALDVQARFRGLPQDDAPAPVRVRNTFLEACDPEREARGRRRSQSAPPGRAPLAHGGGAAAGAGEERPGGGNAGGQEGTEEELSACAGTGPDDGAILEFESVD